ncbi:MAG TPA: hypothetical protein VIG74_02390 [Alphaproteobacteria bacterium]|jgi:Holliday junction resolvase RusA-like endonuclease
MRIEFTIYGNHEDRRGNPLPYHRATQRSKWSKAHQRYIAWKAYVQKEFAKAARGLIPDRYGYEPIGGEPRALVEATIFFLPHLKAHGDPDNIVKGISDALFESDKEVDVQTRHTCGNSDPRVEIKITIDENV